MRFNELLGALADEPLFETGLLLVGDVDPADVRRQLSRWDKVGKVQQLRRGLYVLAPLFRKKTPHPFVLANRMVRGSYVSCQSALAFYGVIPEFVPEVTSVAAHRPGYWETPLGRFSFRHVKRESVSGYRLVPLGDGWEAFVASPEKALLDLVHLTPRADSPDYLRELRLDHEKLNYDALDRIAVGRPKLMRAARRLREMAREEQYTTL